MTTWIDIGPMEAIPQRGARMVRTAQGCIAVFRAHDDAVFATANTCPHRGGPLAEGIVHGHNVTCPLHNYVISLETGEAQGPDTGRIPVYAVRIEAGRVMLDASSLNAAEAA